MKDVWKSVKTRTGALCVMIYGTIMMPAWCANSLDSPDTVSSWDSLCQVIFLVDCFWFDLIDSLCRDGTDIQLCNM